MNAFSAESLHYVLTEDRHGFFAAAGIARPISGGEELSFGFVPSSANALSYANCPKGTGPLGDAFDIAGTITVQLPSVRLAVPGNMTIAISNGSVSRGRLNGAVPFSGHELEVLVDRRLGTDAPSLAILSFDDSESFWHPAPKANADDTAAIAPFAEFGRAAALLSRQPVQCKSRWRPPIDLPGLPGDSKPPPSDPTPPAPFATIGPSVSVPFVGAGRMTIDVTWPGDATAVRFSLPVVNAARTASVKGFRIVGTGSQRTPLPASLTAWAGCSETQGWLIFLEAFRDPQGKLVPKMSLTWGEGCNRLITCSSA